jgi:hypothetical protein
MCDFFRPHGGDDVGVVDAFASHLVLPNELSSSSKASSEGNSVRKDWRN